MSATLSLEPGPPNVDRASQFTEETLDAWGLDGLTDIACLVVAELVRNAFEHARTAVTVDLQNSAGDVRIAVRDGASLSRRRKKHRKWSTPVRGLTMVTSVAWDWGVEPTGTGKVVWAVVTGRLRIDGCLDDPVRDLFDFGRTAYAGFRVYMIDEPSAEPQSVGRAIVTAPDGAVAWLVWEANVRRRYLRELRAPDDERWGAWRVGLRQRLRPGADRRADFSDVIPDLRLLWEAWRIGRKGGLAE